ncbi:MAG: uracil-DNA glycosylase [Limnochordaceae bacterium]|nr:uracil-DNA glycosylase [Limnochordaceae bacterium]
MRRLSGARDLQALEAIVKGCTRCGLRATCTQVVFGEGHPRARLMLVGEGPGQVEDETGRPFVGPAGQLLDRMLAAIGLSRRDVYIANVVKCRPPNNRVPTPDEMAACWPNLRRQIELIRPSIVLCLGATAARQLVEPRGSISSLRGRWYVRDGIRYLVTFHPAALLRDPSKKPMAWQDLQMVQRALAELQAASA